MRIPKILLITTILFNLSQSLFAQDWQFDYGTAYVDGQVAASWQSSGAFVQLWGDNAIIWKYGSTSQGLRLGSATDFTAANWTERIRIRDNGFVGIGTSDPQAPMSFGPSFGGGKRLLIYDNGPGSVQAGFGVDMSGSFRELSVFHPTSDGTDGDISFGKRLESSGAYTEAMRITGTGSVGIGTSTPFSGYKLDVVGTAKSSSIEINNGIGDGGRLVFHSQGNPEWRIRNFNGLGFFPGEGQPTSLWLDNSGSIGVGVQDTKGYKFAVNGSAVFTKVVVKTQNNWPDYVFQPKYRLRPLSEVEQYINQYHHLPEVTAAEEIEKNGLDLGDNQATLLKKIEELTLYAIQQNKKIEEQEQKQAAWEQQMKLMQEQINQLKGLLESKTNK